jgi:hypothetical protein
MDKMANWPVVLDQFQKTIATSHKTVEVPSLPPGQQHFPYRLLQLIARNNTSRNYNAIEANILYAAMHVACMKELHCPTDACPDLPDNLDTLLRT